MSKHPNYYEILKVTPDAESELIQSAYHTHLKALKKHPDLGGSDAEAQLLNEAYAVLKDPDKRRLYDAKLNGSRTHTQTTPRRKPASAQQKPQEQRRAPRADYHENCRISLKESSVWSDAKFRNISKLGACIASQLSLKKDDLIMLNLAPLSSLQLEGVIRWCRAIPQRFGKPIYEYGIEFQNVEDADLQCFFLEQGIQF